LFSKKLPPCTQKKNDCVAKAQLLVKYKGLAFCDPDSGKSFFDLEAKYGVPPGGKKMDGSWLLFVRR
jgi:hypothetical protein